MKEDYYQGVITESRTRLNQEPSNGGALISLTDGLYYNGDFAEADAQGQSWRRCRSIIL